MTHDQIRDIFFARIALRRLIIQTQQDDLFFPGSEHEMEALSALEGLDSIIKEYEDGKK